GGISHPIDRRVKNVSFTFSAPLQPSVSLAAGRSASANYQADVTCSVLMHHFIQSYRLAFTIGHRRGFDLLRRLPLRAKSVWDLAQSLHPMVNQAERHAFFNGVGLSHQDRLDAGHLAIVGCSSHAEENRLGEAGKDGEADEAADEEQDFPGFVGMDAYHNHSNYGSYKQCS